MTRSFVGAPGASLRRRSSAWAAGALVASLAPAAAAAQQATAAPTMGAVATT
jgi:hypothetical protein